MISLSVTILLLLIIIIIITSFFSEIRLMILNCSTPTNQVSYIHVIMQSLSTYGQIHSAFFDLINTSDFQV